MLSLPAPAKLNLFLHITGRRADGYHELQTLFQLLDYGDTLNFTPRADETIQLLTDINVPTEQNLVWKAAHALREKTNSKQGADIHLIKQLPMGGGLGGGSSNAATTLVGLNYLWQTGLSLSELMPLAQKLGADVPVFVHGYSAWAEGIGEQFSQVNLTETWYLVIHPPCQVNTTEIFSHPELTRNRSRITIANFLAGDGHNDFEPLVRKYYPGIQQAWDWLAEFAPVRLTGTGSSLFAAFPSQDMATHVMAKLPAELKGFVAKGVNRSPLFALEL